MKAGRRILCLGGFVLLLAVAAAPAAKLSARDLVHNLKNKTYSGDPVELRFTDAGLVEILAKFEEISGLVFKIGPSVDMERSGLRHYNFLGYRWDQALGAVLSDFGLEIRLKGGELWVERFTPERDRTVSAFVIGSVTAAALACGLALAYGWRRRRRRAQVRAQKISLAPEAIETAAQRLNYMFQVEKVYRNDRTSLDSLSERLGLQPYQLSGIINSRMGRSFTELVADYRVDEVKKRLSDPEEKANILNIAYDAGFGTKASFNRVFKDRTGLTPSEFRRKNPSAR
jgi:AraC-like DNA-binding protein